MQKIASGSKYQVKHTFEAALSISSAEPVSSIVRVHFINTNLEVGGLGDNAVEYACSRAATHPGVNSDNK